MDMDLDNTDNVSSKSKKVNKKSKLIIFILVPLTILVLLYTLRPGFRKGTNNLLSKMPGFVGEYFRGMPTDSEKQDMIDYLAESYLGIDSNSAAEKTYIIKKEDKDLYTEVIKSMNRISPEETENVLLKVRSLEMRKNLLKSSYDEAREKNSSVENTEVSRLESLDLDIMIKEMEKKFRNKKFQNILMKVSDEKLARGLYYINPEIKAPILDSFDIDKKISIDLELEKIESERKALNDLSRYYETKPVLDSIQVLGNNDTYDFDKLAIIFRNMDVIKSAEILSLVNDDEFIDGLFNAIIYEDKLLKEESNIVDKISNNIELLNTYKSKIDSLVKAYGDMSPEQVAKISEKMLENNKNITVFSLDLKDVNKMSDREIIIDILSKIKKEQLSKVLDSMKPENALRITELLAK